MDIRTRVLVDRTRTLPLQVALVLLILGLALGLTAPAAEATQKCNNWFYDGYACQTIDDESNIYVNGVKGNWIYALHTSRGKNWAVCDYDSYFWIDDARGSSSDKYYHVAMHYGCSGPRAWFDWNNVKRWVKVNSVGRAYWKDTATNGFKQITTQTIY